MNQDKLKNGNGGYDLIGDIHGHAGPLKQLLARLGYTATASGHRHPERQVVFLGDFIDRGPAIRETLAIVKPMVDSGAALAVMGNHEFNAIAYDTPSARGGFLRQHSEKNRHQHQATLDAFAGAPEEWKAYLNWFKSLPLYLEMPGIRVVHANWDDAQVLALGNRRLFDDTLLEQAAVPGTMEFEAVETLLKGKELRLPDGHQIQDKEGVVRRAIRVKWWVNGHGLDYRDLAFPENDSVPRLPVPAHEWQTFTGYPTNAPPVFMGHYWLPPGRPQPLRENIACLDYSVAGGGPLVAYRWNGEATLNRHGFVASH